MNPPLLYRNQTLNFLLSLLIGFIAFAVLTSGAFLIDREFYEFLSSHKTLHILILNFLTILGVFLCGTVYRAHPESFSRFLPVRLFSKFLEVPPVLSVTCLCSLYFLTQFLTLVVMHRGFGTSLWDFGFHDSIIWNTAHGRFLMLSVRGGQNALGEHFTPIFIFLAPVYWISNSANALFLVQTLLVAACIPLTYGISRKLNLSHATSLTLAVVVFFYQPLRNGLLHSFQAQTFADPFLLLGFYLILAERKVFAFLSFAVALMGKENIVMEVLGIGLFAIAQKRRIGWGIAALAVATFLFTTKIIEPVYGFHNNWDKWRYYSHITHPTVAGWVDWAKDFFGLKTLGFLFLIFMPLLFLPLKAKNGFWLLAPTLAVRLLTPFVAFRIITAHYTAGLNALLFIASAYGFQRISEGTYGRIFEKLRSFFSFSSREAFVRTSLLLFALLFAGIPQLFRFENHLWEASNPQNQHVREMLNRIPPQYSVVATETLLAQLTHRPYLFGFTSVLPGTPLEKRASNADLLIVDHGRLQAEEARSLASYQTRGYQFFYEYSYMTLWKNPSRAEDEVLNKLVQDWKKIEGKKEVPYRKIVRRTYKKIVLVLILAYFIASWKSSQDKGRGISAGREPEVAGDRARS